MVASITAEKPETHMACSAFVSVWVAEGRKITPHWPSSPGRGRVTTFSKGYMLTSFLTETPSLQMRKWDGDGCRPLPKFAKLGVLTQVFTWLCLPPRCKFLPLYSFTCLLISSGSRPSAPSLIQNMSDNQMPTDQWMDNQNVVCIYNGI